MRLSLLASHHDRHVTIADLSWPDLAAQLRPVATDRPKESLPAWCPTTFRGNLRQARNAIACSAGVCDFDDVPSTTFARSIGTVQRLGLAAHIYTTYSNAKARASGLWRFRVVMPLSRPILAAEWSKWAVLWFRFWNREIDPRCKDIGRIYYGPFVPAIDGDTKCFTVDGQPFPVDQMLALPLPEVGHIDRTATIQRDTLVAIARRFKASRDFENIDLGLRLLSGLNGEPFAEPGERDNTLWSMSVLLARKLPHTNPESIASHFATALARMGPDCPDVEAFADKIRRAQEQSDEVAIANVADKDALRLARIREAFASDRTAPYSDAELQAFREREQCDEAAFTHRWIVQFEHIYYLYLNGEYTGPYGEKAAHNAALRDLAPAPVQLYSLGPQGEAHRKSLATLVQDYGSVAKVSEADLCAQRTYYDADRSTLIEAAGRMDRSLTPQYDPAVEQWLRLLSGSKLDKLSQWLSWVTELSLPCVALFLTGSRGTGKSLLAAGIARLWETDPTPLSHAMGEYNNRLVDCPFCLADEGLPRDRQGHARTTELREFIQARSRLLRRKYLSDTVLKGAVRVMMAANSRGMLEFKEQLGAEDIQAIAERFVHVPVSAAARDFLNQIPHGHWVTEGTIARHVLYLAQHRGAPDGRFLVKDDSSVTTALSVRSGLRSELCRFLVEYLLQPMRADISNRLLIRIHEKRLLVTVRAFDAHWPLYVGTLTPRLTDVNKALQPLCLGEYIVQLPDGENQDTRYRVVDNDKLVAWVEDNEFTTPERLRNALAVSTELRMKTRQPYGLRCN